MIEELIKLLRELESNMLGVLRDLHHLRALVQEHEEHRESIDFIYVLEVLDRIISKVE